MGDDGAGVTDSSGETNTPEGTGTLEPGETESGAGGNTDFDGEIGDIPGNLEVTNHELYETNGEVGLRGTIQNMGDSAFELVQAEVTLQDDAGDILYEFIDESEDASVSQLEAGSEWQFDVTFEEAQISEVTSYTIDVDGYLATDGEFGDITGEVDDQDDNIEILSSHLTRQESQTFVVGDIKNVGQDDVENIEVNVKLYDEEDSELFEFNNTVEQEDEIQMLSPGQIWEFQVDFDDIDMQQIARYVVTANSELV